MDFIVLMALSNWGIAQFKPELNNPGGRAYEVDYAMPELNKIVSAVNWTTANTKAGKLIPILFLSALCSYLRSRGVEPGEILMSQQLYTWLRMDETTRLLAHGSDKKAQVVTQSELSALLTETRYPLSLWYSVRWVSTPMARARLSIRGMITLSLSNPLA